MNGPESQKPDPAIHTFTDDAGRLVETYQRQIILGSILTLVLGMWAISHGCDQSKQAQIERQQQNAKKYNTAPGLPQASTINGQKVSIAQQEAADRAARQAQTAGQPPLTPSQMECISKLPTGLPEAQWEALKALYCPNIPTPSTDGAATKTSGAYNNSTPYPTPGPANQNGPRPKLRRRSRKKQQKPGKGAS